MDEKVIELLDEITDIIKNDKLFLEFKDAKKELEEDKILIDKIEKLKKMDIYSEDYLFLKKEIMTDEKYVKYNTLENKIYLLVLKVNQSLNTLKNEE